MTDIDKATTIQLALVALVFLSMCGVTALAILSKGC